MLEKLLVSGGFGIAFRLPFAGIGQQRQQRFGGEHAGFDGGVGAFDARYVEKAGAVANQGAAGEAEFGQALQAAFDQRARAVGDAAAAGEHWADGGVIFETLEFFKGREIGVLVIKSDHKADGDLVVVHMVDKGAAVGFCIERPTGGVHRQPALRLAGRHFPDFFDADAVGLRLAAGIQIEAADQGFGQRAACAFGKQGLLRVQLHPRLVVVAARAVFFHAHIAGGDAFNRAVGVVEHLGDGKTGIDFDAEVFRLLRQPAGEQAEADDVVAVVLEAGRSRQPESTFFVEKQHFVFAHRAGERRAGFAPVG